MTDPARTILPPNATALETALDRNMTRSFPTDLTLDKTWAAADCPVSLLPFLAWALSVDVWDSNWPESVKRQVVASAVYVHRFKGTRAGLTQALAALDLGVTISEWFEHGGEPYTFKADVLVSERGLSEREFQNIVEVITSTKNARSHLSELRVYLITTACRYFGTVAVMGEEINVLPWTSTLPVSDPQQNFALATQISETLTVGDIYA